jgi:hypothetical protein
MTTKFTITRMVKTMMPMTKLPPITKLPNASMTWPAAAVPSWPRARISRVEARLSARRSIVAMSSTVGKAENSSGAWMNSDVIRISTERMIEMARNRSSSTGGKGRIRTTRMVITPIASAMSPRLNSAPMPPKAGSLNPPGPGAAANSVIVPDSRRLWRSRAPKVCVAAAGPPGRTRGIEPASKARLGSHERLASPPRQNLPGSWLARG